MSEKDTTMGIEHSYGECMGRAYELVVEAGGDDCIDEVRLLRLAEAWLGLAAMERGTRSERALVSLEQRVELLEREFTLNERTN